jgi:anti-sigma regulatory factor (Ser/Thr protein kinase)
MQPQYFAWIVVTCFGITVDPGSSTKTSSVEQEIQKFLSANGFKYVTLIEESTVPSEMMSRDVIYQVVENYDKTSTISCTIHCTTLLHEVYNLILGNV